MPDTLEVTIGQYSDRGRKPQNQDFHGSLVPAEPALASKGICIALADGISSSDVSQVASELAVKAFLEDYYATSDAWSVHTAAERVLLATNRWLYSQTRSSAFRYEADKGYACTFSALVLKSTTAHVLHAGDARIYRLEGGQLRQITRDHRLRISDEKSYLSCALGVSEQLRFDYQAEPLEEGSVFVLATDGVYEHLEPRDIVDAVARGSSDLDEAARGLALRALAAGSQDNLTVQIVRVDSLPEGTARGAFHELGELPLPPAVEPGEVLDGYHVVRRLHASHRSHVYLARDAEDGTLVALKLPSTDLRQDPLALDRFLMEEWVARRIDSPHVLPAAPRKRPRAYAYLATQYLEGQSLAQWMIDHPGPDLEVVRGITEQIARGLQAFHRQDMLHQDLRPENVLIDETGTAKILDFGSVCVAGVEEIDARSPPSHLRGTAQYAAPEYFLGEPGTRASDIFSLAVLTYQMLSGRLPYGTRVAQAKTLDAQRRLVYSTVLAADREIPVWFDDTLKRALHPNPRRRYAELSEFVYDLRHPNREFAARYTPPLIERNPAAFWRGVSLLLLLVIAGLLLAR